MPSFYAQYLMERTCDKIIETQEGFATYRFIDSNKVYIVDIFVLPEFRKKGIASKLADEICKDAIKYGCKELLGTVCPSAKGANASLEVLLAYGMQLCSISGDLIVFKKGL